MNKMKILLGYIIGFSTSVLITLLCLLFIAKYTVFDKKTVKKEIKDNNYSKIVYDQIMDNIKNYMVSSGLPESVLDGIFTEEEIASAINKTVDNMYMGNDTDYQTAKVGERLSSNINEYLTSHELELSDSETVSTFVKDVQDIYENEMSTYNYFDDVIKYIPKIDDVINAAFIGLFILVFINLIILLSLKINYMGAIFGSSGLIILFIKCFIYNKIDFENILIISNGFSTLMKIFCRNIDLLMLKVGIILLVFGALIVLIKSFSKNDLKKRK